MMNNIPVPQQIYRHFKGNLYQVLTTAEHTETGEDLVIYQALYGDFRIYARPLSMFTGKVDRVKYPDAAQEYRFEPVTLPHASGTETAGRESEPEPVPPSGCDVSEAETPGAGAPDAEDGPDLDPLVMEFLDSDSYEQRLNILAALHHRIADDMIATMAVVCDIELSGDTLEARFEGLKHCLQTLQKYECTRALK